MAVCIRAVPAPQDLEIYQAGLLPSLPTCCGTGLACQTVCRQGGPRYLLGGTLRDGLFEVTVSEYSHMRSAIQNCHAT